MSIVARSDQSTRSAYTALAHDWDGRFWCISVGVGGKDLGPLTQAASVRDVEPMAREAIAIRFGVDEDSFDVEVTIDRP